MPSTTPPSDDNPSADQPLQPLMDLAAEAVTAALGASSRLSALVELLVAKGLLTSEDRATLQESRVLDPEALRQLQSLLTPGEFEELKKL